jgi:hypothetical protein
MDANKAAYWIAVGVLAMGLNSEYRQGNFVALHRVAERADAVLCGISVRAERTLAVAMGMTRGQSAARWAEVRQQSNLSREQAREQAEFARDQVRVRAEVMRAQAEMRGAAMEQVRWRTESQFQLSDSGDRGLTVFCPKTGTRIFVGRGDASEASREVDVDETF